MFSFVEFVTFPPTRFTKKSSVILPSSSDKIPTWQKNGKRTHGKIFQEIFRKKLISMDLELFSLTVTRRPISRPSVRWPTCWPNPRVTLFVSNLFLFYPFSQNFSFQKILLILKIKNYLFAIKKLFFRKILRTEIFKTSNFGFSPDFKFFWTWSFFLFLIQNEEIWESSVLIGWWQWQTDYVIN